MHGLEELLALSIRMNNEITDLSSLTTADLPHLRELLQNVQKLPVLVTHINTLQNLVSFLERYNTDKRVSLESCMALGFAFTPLTYSTTDRAATLSLDKTFLDKEMKVALVQAAESMKSSTHVMELKRVLFPGPLSTASMQHSAVVENISGAASLSSLSSLSSSSSTSSSNSSSTSSSTSGLTIVSNQIDITTARTLLDFFQKSIIIFPEEDALQYILDLPDFLISHHDNPEANSTPPRMSLERVRFSISWLQDNLLTLPSPLDSRLSRFPIVAYTREHYIEPFIQYLQGWEERIAHAWLSVQQLLSCCERGCCVVSSSAEKGGPATAAKGKGINKSSSSRSRSAGTISVVRSCSLEQLHDEVVRAILSTRESDTSIPTFSDDPDALPTFVAACLSDEGEGKDRGLHREICKEYLVTEEKVSGVMESAVNDCHLLDSIILTLCDAPPIASTEGNADEDSDDMNSVTTTGASDLTELRLMHERWGGADHFLYVPLKLPLQEQLVQRHQMMQLLLQIIPEIPVQLPALLRNCEGVAGKAYLPAVLEALLQQVAAIRQLYSAGMACLQCQVESEEGQDHDQGRVQLNADEDVMLSQLRFPTQVETSIRQFFSRKLFEAWSLEAWHVLWSGAPLAAGEALLEQLENNREQWLLFITHEEEASDDQFHSKALSCLSNCVTLTQNKQQVLTNIQEMFLKREIELNQSYEDAVVAVATSVSPSVSSATAALEEFPALSNSQKTLNILVEYIEHFASSLRNTELELSNIAVAVPGVSSASTAQEILSISQLENSFELSLVDNNQQFHSDITRLCHLMQQSSLLLELLPIALRVEGRCLTQSQSQSQPAQALVAVSRSTAEEETLTTSLYDVVKCCNIWGNNDPTLHKYFACPILRWVDTFPSFLVFLLFSLLFIALSLISQLHIYIYRESVCVFPH